MAFGSQSGLGLDATDWHILRELQADARVSFSELGRRVSLSQPAAAERVRKLEEAGVICGYGARVNAAKLGRPVLAIVSLTVPIRVKPRAMEVLHSLPEVIECHHVAGEVSLILKVQAINVARLERLIEILSEFGDTMTSIVLSSPIAGRPVAPPAE